MKFSEMNRFIANSTLKQAWKNSESFMTINFLQQELLNIEKEYSKALNQDDKFSGLKSFEIDIQTFKEKISLLSEGETPLLKKLVNKEEKGISNLR